MHVCGLQVVKTAIAPAKHVLGQQHIADVGHLRIHSVGLMHNMCQCCQALHSMHCTCCVRRENHIGKAKFGDATVTHFCEHGKEVLLGTPHASRSLQHKLKFFPVLENIYVYACACQIARLSGETPCTPVPVTNAIPFVCMCESVTTSCYLCFFVCYVPHAHVCLEEL